MSTAKYITHSMLSIKQNDNSFQGEFFPGSIIKDQDYLLLLFFFFWPRNFWY